MRYDENVEMYHSKIAKKEEGMRLLKEELEKFKEENVNKTKDVQAFRGIKVSCNMSSWELARESVKKGHDENVFLIRVNDRDYETLTLGEVRGIVGYLSDKILYLDTGRTPKENIQWFLSATPRQYVEEVNKDLERINKEGGIRK